MIYGEKVLLRALTRSDLPRLVQWRNDPEVKALLGGWSFPISPEQEEKWLAQVYDDRDTCRLAIQRLDTEVHIGNIGLYQIDWKNRKAEYAILIGDRGSWGQGFGLDATRALLDFAFNEMNLHRISLEVLAQHKRAIRLYEKAGFRVEGRLREDNFKRGQYLDTLIMSILAREFQP